MCSTSGLQVVVCVILGKRKKISPKDMHAWIFAKESILCLENDLPEEVSAEKIFLSDFWSKKERELSVGHHPNTNNVGRQTKELWTNSSSIRDDKHYPTAFH